MTGPGQGVSSVDGMVSWFSWAHVEAPIAADVSASMFRSSLCSVSDWLRVRDLGFTSSACITVPTGRV